MVLILVLPSILLILHPLLIPCNPAGEFGSVNLTLRSPSARKKTVIPKSPAALLEEATELMPPLIWSHSAFFMAKLHLSTGAGKPVSILY